MRFPKREAPGKRVFSGSRRLVEDERDEDVDRGDLIPAIAESEKIRSDGEFFRCEPEGGNSFGRIDPSDGAVKGQILFRSSGQSPEDMSLGMVKVGCENQL